MNVREINGEDILLWPNGSWCYRYELEDNFGHLSDDYVVIPVDTPRWQEVVDA